MRKFKDSDLPNQEARERVDGESFRTLPSCQHLTLKYVKVKVKLQRN